MNTIFDIAIIGGGLGGLTMSIRLAQAGRTVILFEKERYPFHKVCGEYISLESWDYLESLDLPLHTMNLPIIKNLVVSAPSGNSLHTKLPLGGFGISRFKIDNELKEIAVKKGVTVMEQCKVEEVSFEKEIFKIQTSSGIYQSKICSGAFGKRSNLDIKWKRPFISRSKTKLNNFIAVKYHLEAGSDAGTIALHNFKDGYCGISKIEDDRYCLCYLTNAENLRRSGSIESMEASILSANPHLEKIFKGSKKIYAQPLSISQISFESKSQVENHILLIGDAAGLITPLCGNGMSMSMHAGKIVSDLIIQFLHNRISRKQMEENYVQEWKRQFGKRLKAGRMIQRFFGKKWMSNLLISVLKKQPYLTEKIIRLTHGQPF